MKKLLLLILCCASFNYASACSCAAPVTFCEGSSANYSNIGLFKITSFSSDLMFMDVVLLDSIYGNFPSDTLTVVGQNGWNCNTTLSFFNVGDSLILNLSTRSDSMMDLIACFFSSLSYSNDVVTGFIEPGVQTKSYQDFKKDIENCLMMVNTEQVEGETWIIYPNPAQDFFEIKTDNSILDIQIFNVSGQVVMRLSGIKERNKIVAVNELERGFYIVRVYTESGVLMKKILKE
jgi:hypothetical protein